MAEVEPIMGETFVAPGGEWEAHVEGYACARIGHYERALDRLILTRRSDGQMIPIEEQLHYCDALGPYGLAVLFWSPRGRHLYFTDTAEGGPDGCAPHWRPPSFVRWSSEDKSIERLGTGVRSPDGIRYATWMWVENDLGVLSEDLAVWSVDEPGTARVSPLMPDATAGGFLWAPDGEALVVFRYESDCHYVESTSSVWAVLVSLPELSQRVILEAEAEGDWSVQWEDADVLVVSDGETSWRVSASSQSLEGFSAR